MKNLIILIVVFFIGNQGFATNNVPTSKNIKPVFDSIQTLFQSIQQYEQLEIVVNFDSLIAGRRKDTERDAFITLKKQGQPNLELATKVRPRGKFRRAMCDFPPLRLNFEKEALKAMHLYDEYDKLKLVTHCNAKGVAAKYLLKEYWTYKLFNEVTDSSFRVHLLEITFIDEIDPTRTIENYAFVIENSDEMAHRLNGELVEGVGILPNAVAPNAYHDALVFNYMIGNSDWRIDLQKNLKLVKHPNSDLYTVVPYDFDFATLVSPPYLRADGAGARVVLQKKAMSFANKTSLNRSLDKFKHLQKTGFTCFQKCDKLARQEKAEMTIYLKTFYRKAKKQEQFVTMFLGQD